MTATGAVFGTLWLLSLCSYVCLESISFFLVSERKINGGKVSDGKHEALAGCLPAVSYWRCSNHSQSLGFSWVPAMYIETCPPLTHGGAARPFGLGGALNWTNRLNTTCSFHHSLPLLSVVFFFFLCHRFLLNSFACICTTPLAVRRWLGVLDCAFSGGCSLQDHVG